MAEDLISIALPRSPALLLISAILVVFVLSYVAYQRFLSPLAGTPGPFVASLSKLWTARQAWQANFHKTLHALHERHGDLVRIAPNQVSTINPEAIRKIYNPSADHTKGSFYGVLGGKRKFDLVSKSDEKTHAFQRRLVARTYTTEAVKGLEPVVNEMIEKLVKRLDSMHDRSFDINHIVRLFTFDVITAMTFSKDFNAIESGQDNGVGKPMYAMFSSASWVCHLPWLVKVHNACMPVIGNWLGLNQRNTALRDFAVVEVEDRKANKDEPDRPDFLSKFFAIHRERPHDFTEEDFISQASTHFSAGFDTTWISICGIIFELLKNPTTKQKLLQELNNAVAAGKLSDPPLFTELLQLPYLQAAMYEGMRLHPAVGFMLQRVVPAAGLDINGTYLPAGTRVSTDIYVFHRNVKAFGAEPHAFKPERWLNKNNATELHRRFLGFGAGSRSCIGKNIALMEISKLLAKLFLRYDIELAGPDVELQVENRIVMMTSGLRVKLELR